MTTPSEPDARTVGRRVGDSERQECVDELAEAFVCGRLSQEEFDDRVERSWAARTDVDLARMTHDLGTAEPAKTGQAVEGSRTPVAVPLHLLVRVGIFQAVLILVAWILGVDLENEVHSALSISVDVWLVGTVSGVTGAALSAKAQRTGKRAATESGRRSDR